MGCVCRVDVFDKVEGVKDWNGKVEEAARAEFLYRGAAYVTWMSAARRFRFRAPYGASPKREKCQQPSMKMRDVHGI